MSRIFVSYRRENSKVVIGRIFDRLMEEFGEENLFMNVDHVMAGADFVEAIESALGKCKVVVAVIGLQWIGRDRNRLGDPDDFVHLEIATALTRDVRIVPVLVNGAEMPQPPDLPVNLQPLSRRNAIVIHDDAFGHGLQRLVTSVTAVLQADMYSLVPPGNVTEAGTLAATGDYVVPLLKLNNSWNARQAAAAVCTLSLVGSDQAYALLADYSADDREAVRAALKNSIRYTRNLAAHLRAILAHVGTHLDLAHTTVSDLSALAGLTSLQSLDLNNTQVRDLSALAGLSSLKTLRLINTPVDDVSALVGLTSLQTLELYGTQVREVTALAGLTVLQELDLSSKQVSDVSALVGLTSLRILDLNFTKVSDVSALTGLNSLRKLELIGSRVIAVSALAELASLQSLNLADTKVSDVSALTNMTSLLTLDLHNTEVIDVSALAELTNLQSLILSNTKVSDVSALSLLMDGGLEIRQLS